MSEHQWDDVYIHGGHYPDGRVCKVCGLFDVEGTPSSCSTRRTPPTNTEAEGLADVLRGIDVARNRLAPLMKAGEDHIWRPAQMAYEVLGNAHAALSSPPEVEVERVAQHVTCAILGYRDWGDATDYRTTGNQDRERDRVFKLILTAMKGAAS